jgi:hypothetical protein
MTMDELVDGCLLGDGHVGIKKTGGIRFSYKSIKEQYVRWLADFVNDHLFRNVKVQIIPGGTTTIQGNFCHYKTAFEYSFGATKLLTPFYDRWYRGGIKVLPDIKLTPNVCRCWYIDDGTIKVGKGQGANITLCCESFRDNDVENLVQMLFHIGIKARSQRRFDRKRIIISSVSVCDFLSYIGEPPTSDVEYKWDLKGYKRRTFVCPVCKTEITVGGYRTRKSCGDKKCRQILSTKARQGVILPGV